ncbi:cytochrome P450 [Prauserella endophytica]|uniref:Cytochrome P450 n=1 Tax=Prauserella endophytica TaxID=1592324 RepID=A0ABY2S107_9PSEU|nr:cytochrome P450 [Prauserella endophytica]TKG66647.1 cytochrome P450 [Prauserella endophytica]
MLKALPTAREHPLDPPSELRRLGVEEPLCRLTYPDGHVGWVVTSYELARLVLGDQRFSSRSELLRSAVHPTRIAEVERGEPAPAGFFAIMDPPEHTKYRRLLTGHFTVRRMNVLQPTIEQIVENRLSVLAETGPPADFVTTFALAVPSHVICALLGVPGEHRGLFERHGSLLNSLEADAAEIKSGMAAMSGCLKELIEQKRRNPSNDLLTVLAREDGLSDDEVAGIAMLILVAGHDTTASMLALGTLVFLLHPEYAEALRGGEASAGRVVEEMLRYLTIVQYGLPRTAVEDIELAGELIRAGDTVTVSLPAANWDSARFPEPNRVDLSRNTAGHLGFGYGLHQCLGQHLARLEMRIAFSRLLRRFPTLELAVPISEIPLRRQHMIYGAERLPVCW